MALLDGPFETVSKGPSKKAVSKEDEDEWGLYRSRVNPPIAGQLQYSDTVICSLLKHMRNFFAHVF